MTRVEHVPTPEEQRQARTYSWSSVRAWDYVPSGQVVLGVGHDSDRKLAGDGARWQLEDRLGHVLEALERRSAEMDAAEAARQAAEKVRLERDRTAWEQAVAAAQVRLVEASRQERLADEIDRWDRACKIRAFVAAVKATFVNPDVSSRRTAEWLAWASDYADGIDPRLGPLSMPEAPKATPTSLGPLSMPGAPKATPTSLGPFLDGGARTVRPAPSRSSPALRKEPD